jgi:hypothetical protein
MDAQLALQEAAGRIDVYAAALRSVVATKPTKTISHEGHEDHEAISKKAFVFFVFFVA